MMNSIAQIATRARLRVALTQAMGLSWTGMLGGLIVVAVAAIALLAPMISPYDSAKIDLSASFLPPSPNHWMGTDAFGRDVLSRVIWGARPSIQVGLGIILIAPPLAIACGLLAGFYRGTFIEDVIMRAIEVLASIPLLIWAIAIVGILGVEPIGFGPLEFSNISKIAVVLALLMVPGLSRVVHASASIEAKSDYVRARYVQGAGDLRIMISDVLPNCLSPLIVFTTVLVASGILDEAALSFVGLGVQPPEPSWGNMLADARKYIFTGEWWLSFFPGLAIATTVTGLNLLGDALRDLLDPRNSAALGNVQ